MKFQGVTQKMYFSLKVQSDEVFPQSSCFWGCPPSFDITVILASLSQQGEKKNIETIHTIYLLTSARKSHVTSAYTPSAVTQSCGTNLTEIGASKYRLPAVPGRKNKTGEYLPQLNVLLNK